MIAPVPPGVMILLLLGAAWNTLAIIVWAAWLLVR